MKAIIIARVSSKEQEDGLSLDAQLRRLDNYIKDKDFELLHEPYQIVESSTRGERKKFLKIVDDAIEQTGKEPLAIITDRVDRFQRGFKEQVYLDEKIRNGKVILHFVSENLIIDSNSRTDSWIRYDMSIMGAKMYCMYVSDNTKKALEENLAQGRPIGKLPVGYLNDKDTINGKERSKGIIDIKKAPLVKEAFELYSTGTYSFKKLAKLMREKGLTTKGKGHIERPISTSHIERMLKDPIYYGIYRIKETDYPHNFGNIISKELFDVCQEVKEGKSRYAERYRDKEYVFKGLLRCKKCGKMFSTYTTKGNNYAQCNTSKEECGNMNVSEKILLEQLKSYLEELVIPPEYMEEIIEDINRISKEKRKFEDEQVERIDKRLKELDKELDTLLDFALKKSITQDEYNRKAMELKDEQEKLLYKKNRYFDASINYGKVVTDLISITSRAWEIFESSKIERKRQLLGMLFSNLEVDDKKLYVELKSPFNLIYELNKSQEWGQLLDLFINFKVEFNINLNNITLLLNYSF